MAADIIDLKDRMKNTADKKTVAEKVPGFKRGLCTDLTSDKPPLCWSDEQEKFFRSGSAV